MENIIICNAHFKKNNPENQYFNFTLCEENITICILKSLDFNNTIELSDNNVLVKVNAFSCNYRDKTLMLLFNKACQDFDSKRQPFYISFGSEFVAEIIAVGKNVKNLKIGDRVIPNGNFPYRKDRSLGGLPTNHASHRMQYFNENQVLKIPSSMSDEIAASFTIASQTVYSIIRRLELDKHSIALVTAATSNTSLAAIHTLVNKGIKTYAISSSQHYEKQLLNLGVHTVIPYSALINNEVREYFNGVELDAVIDPFFDLYFPQITEYMKQGSKYIFCGFYNQSAQFNQLSQSNESYLRAFSLSIMKNMSIIGNCLGTDLDLQNALDDYEQGNYNIIIDSIYKGESIIPFLEKTFHSTPRFGKVVYKYF